MMENLKIAIIGAGETSLLAATAFGTVYPVIVFDPDRSKKRNLTKRALFLPIKLVNWQTPASS